MHRGILNAIVVLGCAAGLVVCSAQTARIPQPETVDPASAPEGVAVTITVSGNFPISVHISYRDSARSFVRTDYRAFIGTRQLTDVTYVDSQSLTATVPADLAVGLYDLSVVDPTGARGTLADAFTVTPMATGGDGGPTSDGGGDTFASDTLTGDSGPVQLEALLDGNVTLPRLDLTALVPLVTNVVADRSVLFFNYSHDTRAVGDALISGQLATDGASVIFSRNDIGSAGTSDVELQWTVLQFAGAQVQRGSFDMTNNNPALAIQVALAPAVDPGRTFIVHSWSGSGGNFNGNDFLRATLLDANTLELSRYSCCQEVAQWQVVELDPAANAGVQQGTLAIAAGVPSVSVTLPTAAPMQQSFLLASYTVASSDFTPAASEHLLLSRMISDTELTFDRDSGTRALVVTWTVVTWDALTIEHGTSSFPSGVGEQRVTLLRSIDPARTTSFLPTIMRGGSSPHSSDDRMGVGWVCDLLCG